MNDLFEKFKDVVEKFSARFEENTGPWFDQERDLGKARKEKKGKRNFGKKSVEELKKSASVKPYTKEQAEHVKKKAGLVSSKPDEIEKMKKDKKFSDATPLSFPFGETPAEFNENFESYELPSRKDVGARKLSPSPFKGKSKRKTTETDPYGYYPDYKDPQPELKKKQSRKPLQGLSDLND